MAQQYGMGQQKYGDIPFSNQQDPSLVNNPRYTGQSGGTQPQGYDGRGPAQETRYGATPVGTGYGDNQNAGIGQQSVYSGQNNQQTSSPIDDIRNPSAYGFQKQQQTQPETGFRFPGVNNNNPQQNQQSGSQQGGVPNQQYSQPIPRGDMMNSNVTPSQAGYGNQGLQGGSYNNQQQRYQGNQNLAGSNAPPSAAGYGQSQSGYGDTGPRERRYDSQQVNQGSDFAQPQPAYGQQGFGAPTQGQNTNNLWPAPVAPAGAQRNDLYGQGIEGQGNQGQGYDVNHQPGMENPGQIDSSDTRGLDGEGVGGQQGPYGTGMDSTQGPYGTGVDATQGPYGTGSGNSQQGAGSHPSDASGFGGGMGARRREETGYDASDAVGDGYDKPTATGADAYALGGQAPGTGGDAGINQSELGTGGGATPHAGGDAPGTGNVARYDGTGYDGTNMDQGTGRETLGQKFKDKEGAGNANNTNTGYSSQDTGAYDDAGANDPQQDTGAYDSTGAPPKKGLMTKIKEKLKH